MQTINRVSRTSLKHCKKCGRETKHKHIESTSVTGTSELVTNVVKCMNCKKETK